MSCFPDSVVLEVQNPLLSFIIPVFNDEKNIDRCLHSIKNLVFPEKDYEVLVLDNGSTDGTIHILRELEVPFKVIAKVHVSVLRNNGARLSQGDFLAFVDSDVELSLYWAEHSLAAFHDPMVVATGCFPEVPGEATWVQQAWDIHQRGRQTATSRPISWLPSMNLVVRRKDFWAVGGFNEQLETAEDVDLCYRLSQRGTILWSPTMKAIHWGEARDLVTFWRKEVWRGIGNFKGVLSHGFRWDELPSLGYPVWVIGLIVALGIGSFIDLWRGQFIFSLLSLVFLLLPAFFLSVNTAWAARCPASVPPLFVLYLTYGLARAYSVVKVCLFNRK